MERHRELSQWIYNKHARHLIHWRVSRNTTLALLTKGFNVNAPSVWNSLSDSGKCSEFVGTLKCKLKSEVFFVA